MDARNPPPDTGYWLALARLPGLGPRRIARLLDRFESPRAVFEAGSELRALLGARHPALAALDHGPDSAGVQSDLAWLAGEGHHLLTLRGPGYPDLLRQIPDPPPVLFVRGDPAVLCQSQVAVVGSRNPTPSGRETATALAGALAAAGLAVTSGLALGIDGAAHRGALSAGGVTIAVCGTGPDIIYPPGQRPLAASILDSGALVSEFPPGTPPRREHFPRRNRLISGLSLGTVVVEAAERSGSLITAYLALDQGREVLAVPGPVRSFLSRGCHRLLREGATLVETVEDILAQLAGPWSGELPRPRAPAPVLPLPDALATVLAHIDHAPANFDILLARSGLDAARLSAALLQLELRGLVAACDGGAYVRRDGNQP